MRRWLQDGRAGYLFQQTHRVMSGVSTMMRPVDEGLSRLQRAVLVSRFHLKHKAPRTSQLPEGGLHIGIVEIGRQITFPCAIKFMVINPPKRRNVVVLPPILASSPAIASALIHFCACTGRAVSGLNHLYLCNRVIYAVNRLLGMRFSRQD